LLIQVDLIFADLNLNTSVQKKTPGKCTFYGWCFKNSWH